MNSSPCTNTITTSLSSLVEIKILELGDKRQKSLGQRTELTTRRKTTLICVFGRSNIEEGTERSLLTGSQHQSSELCGNLQIRGSYRNYTSTKSTEWKKNSLVSAHLAYRFWKNFRKHLSHALLMAHDTALTNYARRNNTAVCCFRLRTARKQPKGNSF
jgi:hypothetical protein